jgi:hypothetical protein
MPQEALNTLVKEGEKGKQLARERNTQKACDEFVALLAAVPLTETAVRLRIRFAHQLFEFRNPVKVNSIIKNFDMLHP